MHESFNFVIVYYDFSSQKQGIEVRHILSIQLIVSNNIIFIC